MGTREHKHKAPKELNIGVLSISTTRGPADDKSGQWICSSVKKEGHSLVFYQVIPDDREIIERTLTAKLEDFSPHAVLLTGGTGISRKDVTIEAVTPLFHKEMKAFGTLFSQLSFEEIDSAAIMSRATAGIIDTTAVFCMPGSLKACKLACKELIFPELGHIAMHLQE